MIRTGAVIDINFKLKYTGDAIATGDVSLQLDYKLLSNGLTNLDTLTFTEFSIEDVNVPAGPYTYKEFTTTTLKLPSSLSTVADKLIICRLSRDYGAAGDTYTGDLQLMQMLPTA